MLPKETLRTMSSSVDGEMLSSSNLKMKKSQASVLSTAESKDSPVSSSVVVKQEVGSSPEPPQGQDDMILCSWCQKETMKTHTLHIPGEDSKCFCGEECFAACRRAFFKRNKVCDWCKLMRNMKVCVVFKESGYRLQFCSEECANNYRMDVFLKETKNFGFQPVTFQIEPTVQTSPLAGDSVSQPPVPTSNALAPSKLSLNNSPAVSMEQKKSTGKPVNKFKKPSTTIPPAQVPTSPPDSSEDSGKNSTLLKIQMDAEATIIRATGPPPKTSCLSSAASGCSNVSTNAGCSSGKNYKSTPVNNYNHNHKQHRPEHGAKKRKLPEEATKSNSSIFPPHSSYEIPKCNRQETSDKHPSDSDRGPKVTWPKSRPADQPAYNKSLMLDPNFGLLRPSMPPFMGPFPPVDLFGHPHFPMGPRPTMYPHPQMQIPPTSNIIPPMPPMMGMDPSPHPPLIPPPMLIVPYPIPLPIPFPVPIPIPIPFPVPMSSMKEGKSGGQLNPDKIDSANGDETDASPIDLSMKKAVPPRAPNSTDAEESCRKCLKCKQNSCFRKWSVEKSEQQSPPSQPGRKTCCFLPPRSSSSEPMSTYRSGVHPPGQSRFRDQLSKDPQRNINSKSATLLHSPSPCYERGPSKTRHGCDNSCHYEDHRADIVDESEVSPAAEIDEWNGGTVFSSDPDVPPPCRDSDITPV